MIPGGAPLPVAAHDASSTERLLQVTAVRPAYRKRARHIESAVILMPVAVDGIERHYTTLPRNGIMLNPAA